IKCVGLISAAHGGTTSILREFCNTPNRTRAGTYYGRSTKVRRHFRLRTEITNAGWGDDVATAGTCPCGGNRADHEARAGSNRPNLEDRRGQIHHRQQEENENRDIALGQLKQPPHESFTQIEQTGMANHSMMPCVKRLVKVFRSQRFYARAPS